MAQGPLDGMRVIEFGGIGPAPFCGMLLSDLGADVVRIDRKGVKAGLGVGGSPFAITERGRRSIALDLKKPEAIEICLDLVERADALIEGYRPGVMERLGLGPIPALARNPKLVYGRMTGWGQTGPNAQRAGHDINFIAISGALAAIGTNDQPMAPLNLVGDFGGGALYLAFGLLAGIVQARQTGTGQVIDCAMSDGAASLMALFYSYQAAGRWGGGRRENLLDGGAPFYDTYRCADGKWVAVGALEPQFYAILRERAGLGDPVFDAQMDKPRWPDQKALIAEAIAARSQAEWCALFDGTDACVTPVMDMAAAPLHPHNVARGTFVELDGIVQPTPAPRFSVTPGAIQGPPPLPGAHNDAVLRDWGIDAKRIEQLRSAGAI